MDRNIGSPLLFLALFVGAVLSSGFRTGSKSGADIVEEHIQRYGLDSRIELIKSVTIDRDGNVTTREVLRADRIDVDDNHNSLLRFQKPDSVAGVALLSKLNSDEERAQFLFMPALGSIRKISGSGQRGYFMGTDFAFEDLYPEDMDRYDYEKEADGYIDDVQCYRITARPSNAKFRTSSGYRKRVLWITKEDYKIIKVDFYRTESEILKTLILSEFEPVSPEGDIEVPKRAEMKHLVRKTASIFAVVKGSYNRDIPLLYFSDEALKDWKSEYDDAILAKFE